jgi:uncharacterized protein (TIGR02599 family)
MISKIPAKGVMRIKTQEGFTIAELLVAAAILALLVVLLLSMVTQTSKTWKATSGKIEEFRGARDAFDTITRRMGQATLNTYLDYVTNSIGVPTAYARQSELRFLSGPTTTILSSLANCTNQPTMAVFFQAPNGFSTNSSNSILQNTLNTWGYFIEYASDTNSRPGFLPAGAPTPRYRYRLMELMEPTENFSVYNYTSGRPAYAGIDWISNSMSQTATRPAHVLAENVIALIILPHQSPADYTNGYTNSSLAPYYTYDSSTKWTSYCTNTADPNLNTHNQLPPVIQITMVAVDETSAVRFASQYAGITNSLSAYFTNAANFDADIKTNLPAVMRSNNFNYRIFTTDVMIKGAKWSSSQTN